MRTWNYRVIERVTPSITQPGAMDVYRAIHEVHYESDGHPIAYSAQPTTIGWDPAEGDEAPLAILDRMREALTKPVLTEQDFPSRDAGIEAVELANARMKSFETEILGSLNEMKNHPESVTPYKLG